jgi:hypothetical protein
MVGYLVNRPHTFQASLKIVSADSSLPLEGHVGVPFRHLGNYGSEQSQIIQTN